jgi:hypothetical protein
MTRLTADERHAIQAELDDARREILRLADEILRLQSMLDAQPAGSDGDTLRLLRALCSCGLPLDHRHPMTGEPRPCDDETARIALPDEGRTKPPVPGSVTRDESLDIPCPRGCGGFITPTAVHTCPDGVTPHGARA